MLLRLWAGTTQLLILTSQEAIKIDWIGSIGPIGEDLFLGWVDSVPFRGLWVGLVCLTTLSKFSSEKNSSANTWN